MPIKDVLVYNLNFSKKINSRENDAQRLLWSRATDPHLQLAVNHQPGNRRGDREVVVRKKSISKLCQLRLETSQNDVRSILEHPKKLKKIVIFLTQNCTIYSCAYAPYKIYREANPLACASALSTLRRENSQKIGLMREKFNFFKKLSKIRD